MDKLISIVIPTYKRNEILLRAIDSCLTQTYKNIEIIVVDDNDPKSEYRISTEKMMKKYADDERVIYIQHEINKNGAAARNTGIKYAKGEYISFLDDDDYYYPKKIEKQTKFLDEHSEFDGVYCWREDDVSINKGKYTGDLSIQLLLNEYMPQTSALMFRRTALIDIGMFNEKFRRHQDVEILLRFFEKYKMGYVPYIGVFMDFGDRSNEIHGMQLEENKERFLNTFSNTIEKVSCGNRKIYNKILISNYINVICDHLQNGYIKRTLYYFKKAMKLDRVMTITFFTKHALSYIKVKIRRFTYHKRI